MGFGVCGFELRVRGVTQTSIEVAWHRAYLRLAWVVAASERERESERESKRKKRERDRERERPPVGTGGGGRVPDEGGARCLRQDSVINRT